MNFRESIVKVYHERRVDAIKNDFGKTLILGGSRKYPNGILIASELASVSGVGYAAIGVPETIYSTIAGRVNLTQIFEPCTFDGDSLSYDIVRINTLCKNYQSILFGPGIADTKENQKVLISLLGEYKGNLIIDATGLKIYSKVPLTDSEANILLTPHLGEARSLLSSKATSRDPNDYIKDAVKFAKAKNLSILLKSNESLLISKDGRVLKNEEGYPSTPCLAKAGSGDGLAGLLAGLLAYADKILGYEETILFADKLLHEAAALSQGELSPGLANILTAKEKIKMIVR